MAVCGAESSPSRNERWDFWSASYTVRVRLLTWRQDTLPHCYTLLHTVALWDMIQSYQLFSMILLSFWHLCVVGHIGGDLKGWTDSYKAAHHGYLEEPRWVCDTLQGAHLTDVNRVYLVGMFLKLDKKGSLMLPSRLLSLGDSSVDFLHAFPILQECWYTVFLVPRSRCSRR